MSRQPKDDGVSEKPREQAVVDGILLVKMDVGDKVFDIRGEVPKFLGIVGDRRPVIHKEAMTCYLSADDYEAAKAALPRGPGVVLH